MLNNPNYRYLPLHEDDDALYLSVDEVRRLTEWTDDDLDDHVRAGALDCVECCACGQRYYRADDTAAAMCEKRKVPESPTTETQG